MTKEERIRMNYMAHKMAWDDTLAHVERTGQEDIRRYMLHHLRYYQDMLGLRIERIQRNKEPN